MRILKFKFFLLAAFLLSLSVMNGQELSMPSSQVRLSAGLSLYSPLSIEPKVGDVLITSNVAPGGGIAISYYQHVGKGFGLSLGVGLNAQSYNIRLQNAVLSDGQLVVLESQGNFRFWSPAFTIPLSVEKTFEGCCLGSGFFPVVSLGLSAQRTLFSEDHIISVFTPDQAAEMPLAFEAIMCRSEKFIMSYFAKVGVARVVTSSSNALQINLVYNYSPASIAEGTYNYYQGSHSGEMFQKANYLGVEFVYGFNVGGK